MTPDSEGLSAKAIEAQFGLTIRQINQLVTPYLPATVQGQIITELLSLSDRIQQLAQRSKQ